uniref:SDR family oxidoreductase n=1 Tax=Rhabditophanes sp. KR3021 TaxID=114890 RepID=A0AC35U8G4_9BILA
MASMAGIRYLADRVAVITGSCSGMGFAVAEKLGECGAAVIVTGRNDDELNETLYKLRGMGVVSAGINCNVGIDADRKKLLKFAKETFGEIDILVNNICMSGAVGERVTVDLNDWAKKLDINVRSSFLLSQEASKYLAKSAFGGRIVFMSSIGGYGSFEGVGSYTNVRKALLGVNKTLSDTLKHQNIRVNVVASGIIPTEAPAFLLRKGEVRDPLVIFPIGHKEEALECATTVSVLASEAADHITGQCLPIYGNAIAGI